MTDRITHWRDTEPRRNEVGIVACGLPNLGLWSDHRRSRANCPGCLQIGKITS